MLQPVFSQTFIKKKTPFKAAANLTFGAEVHILYEPRPWKQQATRQQITHNKPVMFVFLPSTILFYNKEARQQRSRNAL